MPVGNLPRDNTAFGADLFYARHLRKQNFVLWCSPTDKPDLGGKEADDNRLLTETDDALSVMVNAPGAYRHDRRLVNKGSLISAAKDQRY